MAWTINVAVLCVVVSIIVAKKKYESPLQVFQEPKDIESAMAAHPSNCYQKQNARSRALREWKDVLRRSGYNQKRS
uniref:Putative secreted protein n=1 Tax=Ixodes ricinus TaxID=34613 RepID=A0A6B0U4A9_IXORI